MAGYFDAGRGREEALFEVKSLGTKTRFVDLVTLLSHSHPLPVFPACPARLLVELVVPLCVVQGVAPINTAVRNFTKLSPENFSDLLFICSSHIGADVASYTGTGI